MQCIVHPVFTAFFYLPGNGSQSRHGVERGAPVREGTGAVPVFAPSAAAPSGIDDGKSDLNRMPEEKGMNRMFSFWIFPAYIFAGEGFGV